MNDIFIIDMKRDVIEPGHLLRKRRAAAFLHLLQMTGGVDDAVKADAVTAEELSDILLRAVRRGVDPYFKSLVLQRMNQLNRPFAQPLLEDKRKRKKGRVFNFKCIRIDKQHFIKIKGNAHDDSS